MEFCKMLDERNKTSSWRSTDSHPSDKNKNVGWMGHGFIECRPAKPVGGLTNPLGIQFHIPQVGEAGVGLD